MSAGVYRQRAEQNARRQHRFRAFRRAGLILVHGYLTPKQARKVWAMIAKAEAEAIGEGEK
jgi:hypothetical protein